MHAEVSFLFSDANTGTWYIHRTAHMARPRQKASASKCRWLPTGQPNVKKHLKCETVWWVRRAAGGGPRAERRGLRAGLVGGPVGRPMCRPVGLPVGWRAIGPSAQFLNLRVCLPMPGCGAGL